MCGTPALKPPRIRHETHTTRPFPIFRFPYTGHTFRASHKALDAPFRRCDQGHMPNLPTRSALNTPLSMEMPPIIAGMAPDIQRWYSAAYEEAWQEAFAAQGWAAFRQDKDSTATHEAGHVVIVHLEGYAITSARIWTTPGKIPTEWVGLTEWDSGPVSPLTPRTEPQILLRVAKMVMAGYMAEHVLESENVRAGSSLDEKLIAKALVSFASRVRGVDPHAALTEIEGSVCATLRSHERILRKIAHAIARRAPYPLEGRRLKALTAALRPSRR